MTDGRGRVNVPPTTGVPPSAMIVALPARTSTRARRNETTASGSYPALSTRVRTGSHPLSFGTLTWLVASRSAAGGAPDDSCRRRQDDPLSWPRADRAERNMGQDDRRRRLPREATPSRQCAAERGGTAQACAATRLRTASRTSPPDGCVEPSLEAE